MSPRASVGASNRRGDGCWSVARPCSPITGETTLHRDRSQFFLVILISVNSTDAVSAPRPLQEGRAMTVNAVVHRQRMQSALERRRFLAAYGVVRTRMIVSFRIVGSPLLLNIYTFVIFINFLV
jgi:hypothetical protein